MTIQNILVATDFSQTSLHAFDHAAAIAARNKTGLHVLHVSQDLIHSLADLELPDLEPYTAAAKAAIQAELDALSGRSEVPLITVQRHGHSVARTILEYAEEQKIDLVVIGSRGRGAMSRLIMGSESQTVARLCKTAVLVVGEDQAPKTAATPKVVVAADMSPHSEHAVREAAELAASLNGKLTVLHVLEPLTLPPYYPEGLVRLAQREDAEQSLADFVKSLGLASTPKLAVEYGLAEHLIVRYATDQQADLLVMARSGLRGLDRLVLGSITERVLPRSPCPVWVIPAPPVAKESQAD
jgi:nucleotide-binding universal stress UspA family protein